MGCLGNPKILSIVTSFCACASFAFLCIAVGTDYWLYAMEKLENNRTPALKLGSHSGLWKICTFEENNSDEKTCQRIDYFRELERDEIKQQTETVLMSVRRATLFPLLSLLILLAAEIVFFVGYCNQRSVLTFLAGILFVVGGLCTLIGIVTYISAITEQAGNKPKSTMDEPKFSYWYGASFYLTVSSFFVSELTGVLSVYLYIVQYKAAYRKKQEHLAMTHSNNERHSRGRSSSFSRENSRDHSPSSHSAGGVGGAAAAGMGASEPLYSYMPVSETMRDFSSSSSNYVLARDPSRHTLPAAPAAAAGSVSVDAQVHFARERPSTHSVHSARGGQGGGGGGRDDPESYRRTTLV